MPKKSMELLTESMFYVLMALRREPMCGIDIADTIERHSHGRLQMGPATLYTILSKFEGEKLIKEIAVEGRKRTYAITPKGITAFDAEIQRLQMCLSDAENAIFRENSAEHPENL